MLHLYICHSAFRSKKSYCMLCMQQLYTYTIMFGFHDTAPPKKNRSFAAQFVHHTSGSLQKLRSSPSIWRDFHWLQWSRVTPTVGEAMLQKREDFHGWKVFPNGRSVIWSELKFHHPTRHSLRVEKTQLLDVTVEGDIRKLISWIHDSTHVQIWNIHIRYILQYAYMCKYWIFNKYSCEAPSKGCQWNLNKWRIDTL